MCLQVDAPGPTCKAVSTIQPILRESTRKGEGWRSQKGASLVFRTLTVFTSLWSFAAIECLSLNLTARFHTVLRSWLKQAARRFGSLVYLIAHSLSPPFFTRSWYSKQCHEDFPFPNLNAVFVQATRGICFIHHPGCSHCNGSFPVCHSHCYSAAQINSSFSMHQEFPIDICV